MNKQTAIDLLDNLLGMVEDNHDSDYDTAIKMGIDALKSSALDCVERQAAIDALNRHLDTIRVVNNNTMEMIRRSEVMDCREIINGLPSAETEIIHCCDCIYYDPEHIEKNGVRYEYRYMPKDAFDILGTGLVNSEYGINVGGRCCRDYNMGYSEDKRVFVSGQNYCGRAERRQDE